MRRTITGTLMLSSLLLTAAAYASPPIGDSAPTHNVSTGITPPQLLDSLSLSIPDSSSATTIPEGAQITVTYVVDDKGQPSNLHVVEGFDPIWNARALDAVSKLHYRPATLDNQPVPVPMNLVINLAR